MRLLLKEVCPQCRTTLFPKDILKCGLKEETNNYVFKCTNCLTEIYPLLKVRIGELNTFKNEDTLFIHPLQLRNYLEERLQLDNSYRNATQLTPELLRDYNKNIYWNLIWHFADSHLPYDFLVPYADDSLLDEFRTVNQHLVVRNKMRLEQLVRREGGVDNYIRYVGERIEKERKGKGIMATE